MQKDSKYYRILFEEAVIGLALCKMSGELVDVNKAYADLIGLTIKQALKLSYWDITPEKYKAKELELLEALEKTGKYGPFEKEYIHKNGSLVRNTFGLLSKILQPVKKQKENLSVYIKN